MSVDAFLDTNVLIYAVSSSYAEAEKKERALELIMGTDFGLSTQVLQEFYVNVTQKIAKPLAPDDARKPGSVFAEGITLNVAQGYELQSAVAELRQRRGERIIGYKIGCTSPTIRELHLQILDYR